MLSTVILIPLIPVWLLVGYFFHQKQFDHLSCVLNVRSINIRSGLLFKKQQNIPLDKITDLSIMGGPFLDSLGISKFSIDTAGSTPFPLTGVANAEKFRDVVFSIGISRPRPPTNQRPWPPSNDVLVEIRDILARIEAKPRKIISLYSVTARTLASSQPSAWSRVVSSPSSCRSRASFNAPNPGPGAAKRNQVAAVEQRLLQLRLILKRLKLGLQKKIISRLEEDRQSSRCSSSSVNTDRRNNFRNVAVLISRASFSHVVADAAGHGIDLRIGNRSQLGWLAPCPSRFSSKKQAASSSRLAVTGLAMSCMSTDQIRPVSAASGNWLSMS